MNFTAPSAAEAELQRVLRLTDNVLRHIVVRVDEKTTKAPAKTEPAPEPREQVTSEPAPEPREQVTSEPAAEATDEPTAEVTGETSESRVEVTS
jgi:hypothetical protein